MATTSPVRNFNEFGQELAGKAQEVKEKAKDAAATVTERARDAAANVAHKASEAASTVGHKAEEATAAVGSGMQSLAGTIRDKGPHSGMMGTASTSVAETLESGGRYLQDEGLKGLGEDLTNLIRRNPLPALLVGIGIGFLLARSTSRS